MKFEFQKEIQKQNENVNKFQPPPPQKKKI